MSIPKTLYSENSELRESIKTLRMNIEFSGIDKPIRSVVITSVAPSEGKSTISTSLAIATAESGKKTLLVENDFRRPRVANTFKDRAQEGIIDMLSGETQLASAVTETAIDGLFVLDVGGRIVNPVEVLSSQRYRAVTEKLYDAFDFIIYDTPPIGSFIDAAVTASYVDGVILVVNSGSVTAEEAKNGLAQLEKAGARILGVVLNGVERSPGTYGYRYRYRYRYDTADESAAAQKEEE